MPDDQNRDFPCEPFATIKSTAITLGLPYFKMRRFLKTSVVPVYRVGNSRQLVRLSEVVKAIESLQGGGQAK